LACFSFVAIFFGTYVFPALSRVIVRLGCFRGGGTVRSVQVHRCGTDGNSGCGCSEWIDADEAAARVNAGEAQTLPFRKASGEIIPSDRAIAIVTQRFPKRVVTSIEKRHIERAYVDKNPGEQKRIERYGELNQELLASVGAGMKNGKARDLKIRLRKRSQ